MKRNEIITFGVCKMNGECDEQICDRVIGIQRAYGYKTDEWRKNNRIERECEEAKKSLRVKKKKRSRKNGEDAACEWKKQIVDPRTARISRWESMRCAVDE